MAILLNLGLRSSEMEAGVSATGVLAGTMRTNVLPATMRQRVAGSGAFGGDEVVDLFVGGGDEGVDGCAIFDLSCELAGGAKGEDHLVAAPPAYGFVVPGDLGDGLLEAHGNRDMDFPRRVRRR